MVTYLEMIFLCVYFLLALVQMTLLLGVEEYIERQITSMFVLRNLSKHYKYTSGFMDHSLCRP